MPFWGWLLVVLVFSFEVHAGAAFVEVTGSGKKVVRKWKTPHVKWRFNARGAPAGAEEAIRTAFSIWENQTESKITSEYVGTTDSSDPELDGFSDFIFDSNLFNESGADDTIAVTLINVGASTVNQDSDAVIREADILVNPAFASDFITTEATDHSDLDLVQVLAHEIGHLYGLAHSFLPASLMYPSSSESDLELLAFFPISKRTLSMDDRAWMGSLYPSDQFRKTTSRIKGRVIYSGNGYVGAQIVAVKIDSADTHVAAFPTDDPTYVVVGGSDAVSVFSGENGSFDLQGLDPGNYRLLAQNGRNFLGFNFSTVNSYLASFRNTEFLPAHFYSSPDCSDATPIEVSTLTNQLDAATAFDLAAGEGACGVDVVAHIGAGECGNAFSTSGNYCEGGGGCAIEEEASPSPKSRRPGLVLIILGTLLLIFSTRRLAKRNKRKSAKKPPRELL